jgi:predicted nucleotidyltransferase
MIEFQKILELRNKIVQQFHPQKVILFGSYAYGTPTDDSDVDLLIILPFEERNPEKATEIWMATKPRFPLGLMVRKPNEYKERLAMGDYFLCEIDQKGEVLYEIHHSRMD